MGLSQNGNPLAGHAPFPAERERAAGEMWRALAPCLPDFGVTRLARVTGLDRIGIPVWNAVVPNSRSIVINQGKGLDDCEARLSAAMEAVERAVACEPQAKAVRASRRELAERGVETEPLLDLVAAGHADPDPDEVTAWIPGEDLLARQSVWVPLAAVSLDRTGPGSRYWQSSDGLAAGSSAAEATVHAVLERVERDAMALWRVCSLPHRCACCRDPAVFGDGVLDGLASMIRRAGLRLRLFEITADTGIPAFASLVGPQSLGDRVPVRFADVTQGNAADFDRARAAIRAVLEAAQSRLTYISGARDDIFSEDFRRDLPDDTRALLQANPLPDGPTAGKSPPTAAERLPHLLEALRQAGCERLLVVPLTVEGAFPFEVVKVFTPGLEHPDGPRRRRFGPRAMSRSLIAG